MLPYRDRYDELAVHAHFEHEPTTAICIDLMKSIREENKRLVTVLDPWFERICAKSSAISLTSIHVRVRNQWAFLKMASHLTHLPRPDMPAAYNLFKLLIMERGLVIVPQIELTGEYMATDFVEVAETPGLAYNDTSVYTALIQMGVLGRADEDRDHRLVFVKWFLTGSSKALGVQRLTTFATILKQTFQGTNSVHSFRARLWLEALIRSGVRIKM
jgi:hypothetical protein